MEMTAVLYEKSMSNGSHRLDQVEINTFHLLTLTEIGIGIALLN